MQVRAYEFITGIETSTQPDSGTPMLANDVVTKSYVDSFLTGAGNPYQESFAGPGTIFTLTNTPTAASAVAAFVNGVFQRQGTDYTIAGQVITMGVALTGAQSLDVFYQYGTFIAPSGTEQITRWVLEGNTVPYETVNGPHMQKTARMLSSVDISALNSGTSGSTTIRINQYRSGALFASATAALPSSSGNPFGNSIALSSSLYLIFQDVLTMDVISAAAGASELSVEF